MRLTERQRRKIIELTTAHWVTGINSKVFYNNNIYRYPQRMQELRKRGYEFASIDESIADSEFDRFWLLYDPYTKQRNTNVPTYARIWGSKGSKNKTASKPVYKYTFNPITNKYDGIPIYQ